MSWEIVLLVAAAILAVVAIMAARTAIKESRSVAVAKSELVRERLRGESLRKRQAAEEVTARQDVRNPSSSGRRTKPQGDESPPTSYSEDDQSLFAKVTRRASNGNPNAGFEHSAVEFDEYDFADEVEPEPDSAENLVPPATAGRQQRKRRKSRSRKQIKRDAKAAQEAARESERQRRVEAKQAVRSARNAMDNVEAAVDDATAEPAANTTSQQPPVFSWGNSANGSSSSTDDSPPEPDGSYDAADEQAMQAVPDGAEVEEAASKAMVFEPDVEMTVALDIPETGLIVVESRTDDLVSATGQVTTEYQIVDGRVIVPPTQQQAISAMLSRPGVRLSVVIAGVKHALRPESRDRIVGLMRREFKARKKARSRAARAAARATNERPKSSDDWISS